MGLSISLAFCNWLGTRVPLPPLLSPSLYCSFYVLWHSLNRSFHSCVERWFVVLGSVSVSGSGSGVREMRMRKRKCCMAKLGAGLLRQQTGNSKQQSNGTTCGNNNYMT